MLTIHRKLNRNFATSKVVMLNTKSLNLRSLFVLICFVLAGMMAKGQSATDKFRSSTSGAWGSTATWQYWNGSAWVGAASIPVSGNNVQIQSGHTVTISSSPNPCADLVVDAGGKLFSNLFPNNYMNIFGDTILCNGIIGNGATFDGISFNIESDSCRILGSGGSFDASRLRKNSTTKVTTKLSIERDVKLRFCGGRQTQIYNNANNTAVSTPTKFNVIVAAGATLTLDSTVSAECIATGSASTVAYTCGTVLNSALVSTTNTTGIAVGMVVSGPGIIPGTTVSSFVAGTSVTLSQAAISTNPSVNLSFGGNTITNTTAINSYYGATFAVPGSLVNCRVYGNGIAPGAYIVSATFVSGSQYTLQLSLPNTGPVSGTVYFVSDGNAAIDGITGAAAGPSAGSYTIDGTMLVSGTIYLSNNCTSTSVDSTVTWTVNNGGLLKVGSVVTAASGASKHTFRVMPGGKFEVFGLPGFTSVFNQTNNFYDFQSGSFTEFSGKGNQSIPFIPTAAPSSGFYGNLKISGYGIKSEISNTAFQIANNFEISKATGAPVFNASIASQFMVGGNWLNYHDSAFIEPSIVLFNRTGFATLTCPSGEVYNTLRYQKTDSSEVKFMSDVTVKTQFALAANGHINLNGNTLKVLSPSNTAISTVLATTARYILGETSDFTSKVKWYIGTPSVATIYGIPFGKNSGSGNITPFGLSVNANVNVDTLVVSTYGTAPTNLPWPTAPVNVTNLNSTTGLTPDNRDATADRFWYVNFTAPTIPAVDMGLTYASGSELPLFPFNNPANIQAQYWNPLASNWMIPPMGTATLNVISISNPPINGVWTLVNNFSPLPIELLQFNGKYQDQSSLLYWSTASETDNDYFVVERSNDGNHFYPIGSVDGAGNSSIVLNYNLRDYESIDKVAYYRLKQVDFNGHYTYSKIIALRNMKSFGNQYINLYPQPANTSLFVEQGMFVNGETFATEIFNTQGALVQRDLHTSDESGNLLLHLKNLGPGMYLLRVTDGVNQLTKSLIIQ